MGDFTKLLNLTKRKCDTCVACCVTFNIEELKKLEYTPCPKLCDKGCSIYPERPAPCKQFDCAWLYGQGQGHHRPDRCGFLLSYMGVTARVQDVFPEREQSVEDLMPRATDFAIELGLVKQYVAVLMTQYGAAIIGGPEDLIEQYRGVLSELARRGKHTGYLEYDKAEDAN